MYKAKLGYLPCMFKFVLQSVFLGRDLGDGLSQLDLFQLGRQPLLGAVHLILDKLHEFCVI